MKRKTIMYIAVSLDGFIADEKGGVEWLTDNSGQLTGGEAEPGGGNGESRQEFAEPLDNPGYIEFISGVDTIIMGMTTYEQIRTELSPDRWPYEGKKSYVFTHRNLEGSTNINSSLNLSVDASRSGVEFVSGSVKELSESLQRKAGKNIWICGGAGLANQFIKEDLIDTYHLTIVPVLLGRGIPLFAGDNPKRRLQLEYTGMYNGMVDMVYSRQR